MIWVALRRFGELMGTPLIKRRWFTREFLLILFEGYALCRWSLLAPRGCHLGGLCASIVALWETTLALREHPERPWGQQDGQFPLIKGRFWDVILKVFWIQRAEKLLFFELVPVLLLCRFSSRNPDCRGLENQVSASEVLQKTQVHGNWVLFLYGFVTFFNGLASSFSECCCHGDRVDNCQIFMKSHPR